MASVDVSQRLIKAGDGQALRVLPDNVCVAQYRLLLGCGAIRQAALCCNSGVKYRLLIRQ